MEHTPNENSLKARVLAAIDGGKVTMRPKWHFLLKAALAVAGLVFLTIALVYLVSFVVFAMRQNGSWYVTCFGSQGLRAFLTALPWALILVATAILALLEVLVRRFAFSYRRPVLYTVIGILAFVTISSWAVARTEFHPELLRRAEERRLPVGGGMYRVFVRQEIRDVRPGFVMRLRDDGFDLDTFRDGVVPVLVTSSTKFVPDARLMIGDHVIVFGPLMEGRIHAFGVRQAPPPPMFVRGIAP